MAQLDLIPRRSRSLLGLPGISETLKSPSMSTSRRPTTGEQEGLLLASFMVS